MATATATKRIRIIRLVSYLAVFQSDLHQTLRSWLYRVWVLLSISVAAGYLLYRFGLYKEVGLVRPAPQLMTDLFEWLILGGMTLIIILTAGTISAERGPMADAVLSRGISRVQYYVGKWHARLVCVLGTYFLLSAALIAACHLLLHDQQMSVPGAAVALVTVAGYLTVVVSCAVAVSAICNNTLLGVAVVWLLLYGTGFALAFLPPIYPSPDRTLRNLPNVLCGFYDLKNTLYLLGCCAALSLLLTVIGIVHFSRRDV
jgi:ABC-type transport system involved in multi-copper enzyme maturation permease subunit